MELVLEKWQGVVSEVTIGATKEQGGSRSGTVTIGGEKGLPFLFSEGKIPHRPCIAFEVWDSAPEEWPQELIRHYQDVLQDSLSWADKCVREYGAKALCVRLMAAHPDLGDRTPQQEAKFIEALLKRVNVPLVIIGCGDDAKDNLVLPACAEAARGERCLIGSAVQDNYKTLVAACLADGHSIIAESPIDINIAKQLNILISDMGLGLDRIVINPTIGALGYGLEYAYSIMERARLATLAGDRMMSSPFICFVGQESWRAKEAKAPEREFPGWGQQDERGVIWETLTACALIQAGADLLVMRHPTAAARVDGYIESLMRH